MLIPSPRHSATDLAAWEAHERNDARRWLVERRRIERMAAEAGALIAGIARDAYGGVSWGKDSVVVAHLIRLWAPAVPLVWVRLPRWDNPDCEAVRDAFRARFIGAYEEIVCPDVEAGPDGYLPTGSRRPGYGVAAARWTRRITGIRAEESPTRRASIARGLVTEHTASPIGHWRARDVYLYLHAHDLPVHPAYACSRGGLLDRDRIRVASLGGLRGTGHGRREWEMHYYGDEMARLLGARS